jgi:outer membrane murein-binding lipoprotein Lpp
MPPLWAEFLGMTGADLKEFFVFVGGIAVLVFQYLNNRKMGRVETKQTEVVATVAAVKHDVVEVKADVKVAKQDIGIVKVETNHMKDALVKATGEAEFGRGKLEGKAEGPGPSPSGESS